MAAVLFQCRSWRGSLLWVILLLLTTFIYKGKNCVQARASWYYSWSWGLLPVVCSVLKSCQPSAVGVWACWDCWAMLQMFKGSPSLILLFSWKNEYIYTLSHNLRVNRLKWKGDKLRACAAVLFWAFVLTNNKKNGIGRIGVECNIGLEKMCIIFLMMILELFLNSCLFPLTSWHSPPRPSFLLFA